MALNELLLFFAGITICPIFLRLILKKYYESLPDSETDNSMYRTTFIKFANYKCKIHIYKSFNCGKNCSYFYLKRIVGLVEKAKYNVSVCMCIMTCLEFQEALVNAHKRGVVVRIISDVEMLKSEASNADKLSEEGIPIKSQVATANSLLHHKFCLFDEYEPTLAKLLTGSLNLTCQGLCNNWENIILTNNSKAISSFSKEFENLWNTFVLHTNK